MHSPFLPPHPGFSSFPAANPAGFGDLITERVAPSGALPSALAFANEFRTRVSRRRREVVGAGMHRVLILGPVQSFVARYEVGIRGKMQVLVSVEDVPFPETQIALYERFVVPGDGIENDYDI